MTQGIFTAKRKPEYYAAVLQEYDISELKEFVLSEFDPDKYECTPEASDVLRHVYSSLVAQIDTMPPDEIVDWCNIAYLSKQCKIIDHKNPERLMRAVADPGSFSDN